MTNLISNAFKYTPPGGRVCVRIVVERSQGTALVSVEDTGIGLSPVDRQRILAGFYRAPEGRAIAKGYGVGLNVVRQLLQSQGAQHEDVEGLFEPRMCLGNGANQQSEH